MPLHANVRVCTHIKVSGIRCGSPALRGEQFCYFHQRLIRGVAMPPRPRLNPVAMIEDEESIQVALMEVINNLMCGTIELKRAELIIRALNVAARNIARVRIGIHTRDMVREVPEYREPEIARPAPQPAAPGSPEELVANLRAKRAAAIAAHTYPARVQTPDPTATHVGTDAFVRPGGPEVPVRSAVADAPPQRKPAESVKSAPKERKNAAHRASGG